MVTILSRRLGPLRGKVLSEQAIRMCAMKASNMNGDLRWAFKVSQPASQPVT
jgi:Cdc6-like AAA superfamily ATPase